VGRGGELKEGTGKGQKKEREEWGRRGLVRLGGGGKLLPDAEGDAHPWCTPIGGGGGGVNKRYYACR